MNIPSSIPCMVSCALMALSGFWKLTNPNPKDDPSGLLIIFTLTIGPN